MCLNTIKRFKSQENWEKRSTFSITVAVFIENPF